MKLHIFVFISLFLSMGLSLSAQPALESRLNAPRPGDEIIKQQVAFKDPGRSGEQVLWDFSQLAPVNDQYTLSYFNARNGKLAGVEHRTVYYYTLSGDSLLGWGFENPTTKMYNDLPEVLLTYPATYGDSHVNYFYGRGLYSDRMEILAQGTVLSQADACGMLVLPDKDTLRNVLRTRTLKCLSQEMQPIGSDYYFRRDSIQPLIVSDSIDYRLSNDSIVYVLETFRWYVRGYRYPVFETLKSWTRKLDGSETPYFGTAFFYPPTEHAYLEEDEENLAVLENENNENNAGNENNEGNPWAGLTYNFYPNPVETNLEMEFYLPKGGEVRMALTDRLGRKVWENNYGSWGEGIHQAQIFVAPFPRGEYVLNMWFDEYQTGSVIMKK